MKFRSLFDALSFSYRLGRLSTPPPLLQQHAYYQRIPESVVQFYSTCALAALSRITRPTSSKFATGKRRRVAML